MATCLPSLVSVARYTSPMPPEPRAPRISYAPSLAPATRDMSWVQFSVANLKVLSFGRTRCSPVPRQFSSRQQSLGAPASSFTNEVESVDRLWRRGVYHLDPRATGSSLALIGNASAHY